MGNQFENGKVKMNVDSRIKFSHCAFVRDFSRASRGTNKPGAVSAISIDFLHSVTITQLDRIDFETKCIKFYIMFAFGFFVLDNWQIYRKKE